MEIKIWSDVRCPFCYIGKRKLEAALEQFSDKEEVRITWKSFQLNPTLETRTDINVIDYFVDTKGVTAEQARQMLSGATQMAAEVGLNFDLEKGVLANSFEAHRLIQMAKTQGLGDEIEEALFKAHFEEFKNIDDREVLVSAAVSVGMGEAEVREMFNSDAFAYEVKQDELEARNIGVRGVPFFVFDDRYAVSGAQPVEVFLETLGKTMNN
ncbi:DsbA family oxidoreductase [Salinimicrobium sp. CAU 1759]